MQRQEQKIAEDTRRVRVITHFIDTKSKRERKNRLQSGTPSSQRIRSMYRKKRGQQSGGG